MVLKLLEHTMRRWACSTKCSHAHISDTSLGPHNRGGSAAGSGVTTTDMAVERRDEGLTSSGKNELHEGREP